MSDFDRTKFSKKKYTTARESQSSQQQSGGRGFFSNSKSSSLSNAKGDDSDNVKLENPAKVKQPTILLKTREPNEEVTASPKKTPKETDSSGSIPALNAAVPSEGLPVCKTMPQSVKFLDDGLLCTENLQEYMQENNDFLVVGVIGAHGVGKSTIANLIANNTLSKKTQKILFKNSYTPENSYHNHTKNTFSLLTDHLAKLNLQKQETEAELVEKFKIQTLEDIEKNKNCTNGIDLYVTDNRIIFLDCQPLMSTSILDELVESDLSALVSEYIPSENSAEILGLQLTAFLMSICHVLILVQDWFFDSNVLRFIQTAEMLKPTNANPEDDAVDHFPHLLLVQNKAQVEDFSPIRFELIQETYKMIFKRSRLMTETNIGMGSGRLISHLSTENCGSPFNLFLIPEFDASEYPSFRGYPPIEEIIYRLRANVLGATKHHLTHVQLTEKTWLIYCAKAWDNVKKSSFFVEYTKLMP